MSQAVANPAPTKAPGGGLEGVVAAKSEICFIDGTAGRLVYRGFEIDDLVEHSNFEEVAFLLWENKLPTKAELAALKADISKSLALPEHVVAVIKALPAKTQPMDALRTAVSALSSIDPDLTDNSPAANRRKAI